MNLIVLYLLLLKASVTSFSGLGSLPVIRQDLVVSRQVITDRQLNAAVAVGRVTPGPAGLYMVSVGYFVAGVPGAAAGLLALVTPALSVILLLNHLRQKAEHPRVKSALQAVVLASAGLLFSAIIPLGAVSLNSPWLLMVAVSSCLLMIFTRIDSVLVLLGAAGLCLLVEGASLLMATAQL
jgi:chromate transporter